eukprot:snap_masked-scaffold_58-processed-gene-0.74-mRNA-1 protein AED:0.06 eAED:1.00 QI:0/0/0/1/1/1/2/0/360
MENLETTFKQISLDVYKLLSTHTPIRKKTFSLRDDVSLLDFASNKVFCDALKRFETTNKDILSGFASEEEENIHWFKESKGDIFVSFDPLDGSQNLPVSLSVGSIFAIYQLTKTKKVTGRNIVAAGYALYSAPLVFCFATTEKVKYYQYSFVEKKFLLKEKAHRIQDNKLSKTRIYSINEGNSDKWDDITSAFISTLIRPGRSVRWMSCMVADVHRNLYSRTGLFSYPSKRLRLFYEVQPLSFIWEVAGGVSLLYLKEEKSILDLEIDLSLQGKKLSEEVHKKSSIWLISTKDAGKLSKMKQDLPLWVGGDENMIRKRLKENLAGERNLELKFLKILLACGVVIQAALMFSNWNLRNNTK